MAAAAANTAATAAQTLDTHHDDMIHDAVLDYYGKRLATCSSDKTIKIFAVDGSTYRLVETLRGHDGPVWQIAWAHPKFGTILASSSYDGRVLIWRENSPNNWSRLIEHTLHQASVNSVAWAPHELGAILACASSDGKVSVLEFKDDGTWDTRTFPAHAIGCNAATWAPSTLPASLITAGTSQSPAVKRLATAGCDNLIKIWSYSSESNNWIEETVLDAHTDWVRDLAWAPNIGLPKSYLASASQDKTVLIWTQSGNAPWEKHSLRAEKFPDVVWRVSWSLSGNVLAVSCGDNKVTLWKENLKGEWDCVSEIDS